MKEHAGEDIVIMLVGNKLDLVIEDKDKREVPFEVAEHFAKEENHMFIEVSAHTNKSVNEAFENLLEEIQNRRT